MMPGYIDPGAGSLLIQALIATIVALPILFRRQVARVAGMLKGRSRNNPVDPD